MVEKIKVLVADDHAVVRSGLAHLLNAETDFEVVCEARDGIEAIDKAIELKPDIVVLDVIMPRLNGLEALISIKEKLPQAKVLILTVSEKEEDLLQALRFGACGYILKSAAGSEVVNSVRKTAAGEATLSPQIAAKVISELRKDPGKGQLSVREAQVLELVGDGLTNGEIAERLFIGESTVRTHIQRLLTKLHLRNRAEAIGYATRHHASAKLD